MRHAFRVINMRKGYLVAYDLTRVVSSFSRASALPIDPKEKLKFFENFDSIESFVSFRRFLFLRSERSDNCFIEKFYFMQVSFLFYVALDDYYRGGLIRHKC